MPFSCDSPTGEGSSRSFTADSLHTSGFLTPAKSSRTHLGTAKFKLPSSFVARYKSRPTAFGFEGLGEFVYRRTYSRLKSNGVNEEWHETVARVVNGTFNMQLRHAEQHHLHWNEARAQREAQEMFDLIFNMKFLPPGRGLWAMGTTLTEEKHLYAALNNCAFVSTANLAEERVKPFKFLMDASMLGVGVGFDTRGAQSFTVPGPSGGSEPFAVPDSREGWVDAFGYLLEAYFEGKAVKHYDFSNVRAAGEPILGFGGVSSGPECLRELLNHAEEKLKTMIGRPIDTTGIVDIMNLIGKCVVSGNVRRTAEIAFGSADDDEYINLKNYDKNPHRAAYGWTSNNSVFAELGMDYSTICEAVRRNGEPGFCWLENMQRFDRMDGKVTNTDSKAMGGNPCLEQTLESFEMCCLVETFPASHSSIAEYTRTLRSAFLYAKTVTLGSTHWEETNAVMRRNRRIGTSMSGIAQFVTKHGLEVLRDWCNTGYDALRRLDSEFSNRFHVPMSIKRTSIKPSGTVSLLAGATPGVHFPIARHYLRRVRLPANSELVAALQESGFHVEPAVGSEATTVVVSFVVDSGEGVKKVSEVSMREQLELAAFLQEHWADNQVSCTVSFDPDSEGPLLASALDEFQYKLKGISFIPLFPGGAFPQMPYEEISHAEYLQMSARLRPVQYAREEAHDPVAERFCDGDTCTMAS